VPRRPSALLAHLLALALPRPPPYAPPSHAARGAPPRLPRPPPLPLGARALGPPGVSAAGAASETGSGFLAQLAAYAALRADAPPRWFGGGARRAPGELPPNIRTFGRYSQLVQEAR